MHNFFTYDVWDEQKYIFSGHYVRFACRPADNFGVKTDDVLTKTYDSSNMY